MPPASTASAASSRPVKRAAESISSPTANTSTEDDAPARPTKQPRTERTVDDFSNLVKSKLQSYSRTGQACDRCKVRKIRCDALPQGCSHCLAQNLDCNVTDRVSGRTERRGYLQQLEREQKRMQEHIHGLEKLLQSKGTTVRPYSSTPAGQETPTSQNDSFAKWSQAESVWIKKELDTATSSIKQRSSTPSTKGVDTRLVGSHLGLGQDNAPWSTIEGTQLRIFDQTINITSFASKDMDEPEHGSSHDAPLYNKSVQAFVNSIFKVNPPLEAPLPARDEAFRYSEWFFLTVGSFVPLLHKPSFLALLTRVYDDVTFKPPVAQLALVHMLFAYMYYQFSVRNEQPETKERLNDLSNRHYHWCLHRAYDFLTSHDPAAIQVLAFITCFARCFPKPGSAYFIAQLAFTRAVELNMHRAVVPEIDDTHTNLSNEMRKRTWWWIFMVNVTLNGRLGRPMPIRLEEYDVDFPVLVPDEYLTEDGITDTSKIGQGHWRCAYAMFQLTPILLELFGSIYAVRKDPQRYVEAVKHLEEQYKEWHENLPAELQLANSIKQDRVVALYMEAVSCEVRLCIRHPSACVSSDAVMLAESTRISEEAARGILRATYRLVVLKSLDTTWYQLSVYIAAILTILVANWQRRLEITEEEMARLREDMDMGLEIVAVIGGFIGSGTVIADQVGTVVWRTIAWIEKDKHSRGDATHSAASTPSERLDVGGRQSWSVTPVPRPHPETPIISPVGLDAHAAATTTGAAATSHGHYGATTPSSIPTPAQVNMTAMPHTGLTTQPRAYTTHQMSSFNPAHMQPHFATHQSGTNGQVFNSIANTYSHTSPVTYTGQGLQPPPMPPTEHQNDSNNVVPTADMSNHPQWAGPTDQNSWHDWSSAMLDPASQERCSANALLTLGNGVPAPVGVLAATAVTTMATHPSMPQELRHHQHHQQQQQQQQQQPLPQQLHLQQQQQDQQQSFQQQQQQHDSRPRGLTTHRMTNGVNGGPQGVAAGMGGLEQGPGPGPGHVHVHGQGQVNNGHNVKWPMVIFDESTSTSAAAATAVSVDGSSIKHERR